MTFAARPVGASNTADLLACQRFLTKTPIIVVLPVPA